MPDSIALGLRLTDDSRRGVTSFTTGLNKVKRSARGANNSVDRLSKSTVGLGNAFRFLAAGLSIRQLTKYTDTWKRVTNQLKVVEKTTIDVAKAQERVFKISQDTRQSLEGTTALYTRMKRAQDTLKVSNQDLETVVVAVNKGIAASGATTKEAEAGLIQLSQAFMSGKLAGDELRSVMENIPIIAQAMAKGLGIPFEEFRDQAKNLKPAQLVKGLLNSAGDLEAAFGRTAITIGQSFQLLENSIVKTFGQLDEQLKLSDQFAEVMGKLGRNMDAVVQGIGAIAGAFTVLAGSAGFKAIFRLMTFLTPGGAIGRILSLAATVGGGYAGYSVATAPDPNNPSWVDASVRQGTWSGRTGILGPENAEGWRARRTPKDWSQPPPTAAARLQPQEGTYDVTRRDYLKAFVQMLKRIPDLLIKVVQDSVKIIGTVFQALATLIKEQFLIVFKNLKEQVSAFINFSSEASGGFLDWMGRQWGELASASKTGKPAKLLSLYKTPPDAISGRDAVDPKAEGQVKHFMYLKSLKDAETKAVNSIVKATSGVWAEFSAFGDDLGILADELARKRQAGIAVLPDTTVEKKGPIGWGGIFKGAYEGLSLVGVALNGLNPTFDKVVSGVENTVNAFATGGPLLGIATGLNSLLHIFGEIESSSEKAARQQREVVDALTMSAEASERAARSIENFARSLTGLSKTELEVEADYGKTLDAVSALVTVNDDVLSSLFGDDLDIASFWGDQKARRDSMIQGGIRSGGMGDPDTPLVDVMGNMFGGAGKSKFTNLTNFFDAFETEEEFLEAVGRLRMRFDDLSNVSGFEAALRNVRDAEKALGNFGNYIDGSFEGALESFQHEKAVQKPIAGALQRLFTTAFENFASFDFATGDFTARDIADLSQREINKLEEMFVNTRLEAAKNGAAKLVAGYRAIEDAVTTERFQADIVAARSTLSTKFGEAGGDVFMQRSAIATFMATLKSIRDSMTLARSRGSSDTVADGDAVVSVPDGGTGSGGDGSPSGKLIVDLSDGDRVEIERHKLDAYSQIFDGAVIAGTAALIVDLSPDSAVHIDKRMLNEYAEIFRGGVMTGTATLPINLSAGYMGASPVDITKHNLRGLDQVFTGDVMNQTAPFTLNMNAGDRTKIIPYALTSLANVFTGAVIDQTAPFKLDMNAGDRTTIDPYPLTSLANVFKGGVIDQTATFELDMNNAGRIVDIKKKVISRLDTVFDFAWTDRQGYTVPSDSILIDPQIISSIDQLIDTSQLGEVKLSNFVNFTVSPADFFFKGVDQIEAIGNALNVVFENFPTEMKAQVPLAELVDFRSEGLRGALFQAVNEGFADGQIEGVV